MQGAQFVLHWVYRWEGSGDAVRPAWDLTVTPATGLHPNHLTELELLGGMEVFYNWTTCWVSLIMPTQYNDLAVLQPVGAAG